MMTQNVFHEKWEKGLTEYLKKVDATRTFGYTRHDKNGEPAKHGYIIDLRDGETNIEVIKKFNVLFGQEDFEQLIGKGKTHTLARHLNSSQVMCYNFFRPMMTVTDPKSRWGYANQQLVRFVKESIGITLSGKAQCQFEHEDFITKEAFKKFAKYKGKGDSRSSEFDFFIQDGETRIYFEIKYTESSFGPWKDRKEHRIINHCAYVEKGYKKMVFKSPFLTQECKNTILSFKEEEFANTSNPFNLQYQLFRNALKADATTYTVFIYPSANPGPQQEFQAFKSYLINGQNHIKALQWEDLTAYMYPEFIEKYITILE